MTTTTHYASARKLPDLSAHKETQLARRVQMHNDEQAQHELILNFTRYAFMFAHAYRKKSNVPFADLVQDCMLALIDTARRFDPVQARFSTYAKWWIRAHVRESLRTEASIPLPVQAFQKRERVKKVAQALQQATGLYPTIQQIEDLSGEHIQEYELAELCTGGDISLHAPVSRSGEGDTFAEHLGDTSALCPVVLLEAREELDKNRELLADILRRARERSERDYRLLCMRLECDEEGRPKTLLEVSKAFGISKERVRQIEQAAIRRACTFGNIQVRGGCEHIGTLVQRIERLEKLVSV